MVLTRAAPCHDRFVKSADQRGDTKRDGVEPKQEAAPQVNPTNLWSGVIDTTHAGTWNGGFVGDLCVLKHCKGGQFVTHVKALPGNPYDGHTLATVIPDMEALVGEVDPGAGTRDHTLTSAIP